MGSVSILLYLCGFVVINILFLVLLLIFYRLGYKFYRGLFARKRIQCMIVMSSTGDVIPDFKDDESEPQWQYLVYEYEVNGVKHMQYSRCKFLNADKYVNCRTVVYHDKRAKYDYLYIDVLHIHKVAQRLLRYFSAMCVYIDGLYVVIMLLHSLEYLLK